MSSVREPTQDRVIDFRYAPDIQQTTICFPDDPHKTVVREDGSLNYGFRDPVSFEKRKRYAEFRTQRTAFADPAEYFAVSLKPRFSHRDRHTGTRHWEEGPTVPVVHHEEEFSTSFLKWTVFAVRNDAGLRADVVIWELGAKPGFGRAPSRVELVAVGDSGASPPWYQSPGTTSYWTDEGLQLPGLQHYAFLRAGDTRTGVFVALLSGTLDESLVTVPWAREQLAATRAFWSALPVHRFAFQVPDRSVQAMVEASARNMLQARETHNGVAEYKVGPTMYRSLFMVDGYFLLEAAHMLGDQDVAFQQGILAILRRVKPDGSIQIIEKHYKETGIAIATIVRQCELMGDDARLGELWPTILRAVEHIRHLRRNAAAMGPEYPGKELFPSAYLDGGISGPYPDYTTPAWILIGLKFARDAGRRLGLHDSEAIAGLYDEIYGGFIRAAQRDQGVTEEGIPYIPMIMEKRAYNKPQTATWAFAQAMYPGEVFGPDHPFVTNLLALLDSVDDEEGIPKETGWIHDQAVWGYSAMFYAQVWLYARRPEKAIDYLYAFANHAAPSRVWREEQSLASSHSAEYCGDMPHNWGSAEFIRLVRNAIVMERGGGLELLAGLPAEWLPTEETALEIESTPTRYGRVSVRLTPVDTIESGDGGDVGVPPTERKDGRPDQGTDTACRYRLTYRREPGVVEPLHVMVHWNGREHESWLSPGDVGASRTVDLPPFQARRTAQGNT